MILHLNLGPLVLHSARDYSGVRELVLTTHLLSVEHLYARGLQRSGLPTEQIIIGDIYLYTAGCFNSVYINRVSAGPWAHFGG